MWVGGLEALDSTNLTQRVVTTWYGSGAGPVGNKAEHVGTVLPRADGSVWLGSAGGAGGGVKILTPDHAATRRMPAQKGRPRRALPDDAVLAMTDAPGGQVFIGTNYDLYVANTDGSRVERLDGPDLQATSSDAMCVLDHTLWIGGKSGLRKLEITSPLRITGRVALLDDPIHVLICDSKDQILLGTSKGVFRFRPSTGALDQPWQGRAGHAGLPNLYVTSIARDHRGRMWVTLYGAGVCVVEPAPHGSQDLVRCMGHKEGVPDNAANAVAIDAKDNAWVSTDSGIVRVDGYTLATTLLQQPDGVGLMAHFSGSLGTTAQGDRLFGGKGLTIVHPEQFRRWQYKAPLVLTAVSEGQQQPSGAIQLGPSIRSVQMSFALLDYSAPERVRYAYRLAGLEDGWTESPTESRIARYTNIPPGDYEFEVKAQNRVGDWTTARRALRVEPAWYETAQARLAGGAAALLLLWSLIRLRMRMLELRAAQLRDEVAQRTQDLLQRTQQLESSRQALRELGAHNARALEEERQRVARELHDELGQQLAAMRMVVSVMKAHGDAGRPPSPSQWQTIRDRVDGLTASMRSLVTQLRPPALDGGLQAALEWLGTEYTRATGTPCTVEVDDSARMLKPDAQTMIFRVAQESLNNVMHHARATQVSIRLQHSVDGCDLRVTDDGVGFDVSNPRLGFGLLSMEERAQLVSGTLRVESCPGDGTSVHLHIPADAVAGPTSP
jgi:signal transduction histidine kinase